MYLKFKLKNKVASALGDSRKVKWLAPLRTMRSKFGRRRRPLPVNRCKKILVIRPDEIGDVVMTSPFFRGLREAAPQAKIIALTNPICKKLLDHCPFVDEVHSLPFRPTTEQRVIGKVVAHALKLRWGRFFFGFDLVLLPRPDADWYGAELAAHVLAGRGAIATNSASFITWSKDPPRSPRLSEVCYKAHDPQSDVLTNLEFLKSFGVHAERNNLQVWWGTEDTKFAEKWLSTNMFAGPVMVFHPPGGNSVLRRWAPGRSREFVEKVLAEKKFSVVVIGGPVDEWARAEFSGPLHPKLKLALSEFTLGQLCALIEKCGYFVGGDSGPMHIAAATRAKVVGLLGPGSETRFSPWSRNAKVVSLRYPCSPDRRQTFEACCQTCIFSENRCLSELSAAAVFEQVHAHFAKTSCDTSMY